MCRELGLRHLEQLVSLGAWGEIEDLADDPMRPGLDRAQRLLLKK